MKKRGEGLTVDEQRRLRAEIQRRLAPQEPAAAPAPAPAPAQSAPRSTGHASSGGAPARRAPGPAAVPQYMTPTLAFNSKAAPPARPTPHAQPHPTHHHHQHQHHQHQHHPHYPQHHPQHQPAQQQQYRPQQYPQQQKQAPPPPQPALSPDLNRSRGFTEELSYYDIKVMIPLP